MKKIIVFIITSLFILPVFSQSVISNDELIIFMNPNATPLDLDNLLDELSMEVIDGPTPNLGGLLVKFIDPPVIPAGGNPMGPITGGKEIAKSNASTEGAGFNYVLENRNITPFTTENCSNILDPVNQPNGGNNMVTAIFDTGISRFAPIQAPRFFDIQDMGYNSYNPGRKPKDRNGHGTHISSIVMKNLENENEAIQLKAYMTHGRDGKGSLFNVIKALDVAVSDNIDIINMSFVYMEESAHKTELKNPLGVALHRAFGLSEMLIVAAAGNDDNDNDFLENLTGVSAFPASFDHSNIISVASSNCILERSFFSNYGETSVDVYAPGENIPGFDHNWQPITMDGTSQATAYVTKLATYLGTHQISFDWEATKCAILNSTDRMITTGYTLTDGYINSVAALDYLINNPAGCEDAQYRAEDESNETILFEPSLTYLSDRDLPTFEINVDKEEKALITIANLNGQILVKEQVQLNKGRNVYTNDFPTSGSVGLYFLMIQTNDGIQTVKFIK